MNVEKLSNGKYKFREKYKCPLTNKWKSVTVTYEKHNRHIEKLAQKELNKKIEDILSKYAQKNTDITMNDLVELYLSDAKDRLKPDSTYPLRKKVLKRIKELVGSDALICNITPTYLNSILPKNHLRNYSKILFRWAYTNEFIDADLSIFIKKEKKKKKTLESIVNDCPEQREYYEREELKELFNTLSSSKLYCPQVLRLILESQTITGKRFGEVTALFEDDIDDIEQIAHIYKRSYMGSLNTPKTDKSIDDIGINRRMVQIKKEAIFLKRFFKIESRYLFADTAGRPFSYSTARAILKNYGYSSKTHLFRKTCASLLAEQGVSLKYIQDRLGHEDDKTTTEIYIKVTGKMKKEQQDYFKNLDII